MSLKRRNILTKPLIYKERRKNVAFRPKCPTRNYGRGIERGSELIYILRQSASELLV